MEISTFFPVWERLSSKQQTALSSAAFSRTVARGEIIHNADTDCTGLLLVESGQLRAFILSAEGREITLYRLFERDLCLFSASCMMRSLQFDVTIQAEKDTEFWSIPAGVYQQLMTQSAAVANYTNELMASRFSEVMSRMEQFMWKSMDKRVAAFLLQEADIEGTCALRITHETIANHLGSHREVITRTLRGFQHAGMVKLSRGMVTLVDREKLEAVGT